MPVGCEDGLGEGGDGKKELDTAGKETGSPKIVNAYGRGLVTTVSLI